MIIYMLYVRVKGYVTVTNYSSKKRCNNCQIGWMLPSVSTVYGGGVPCRWSSRRSYIFTVSLPHLVGLKVSSQPEWEDVRRGFAARVFTHALSIRQSKIVMVAFTLGWGLFYAQTHFYLLPIYYLMSCLWRPW